MHSVFLYHAVQAGMDMGIVNAGMLQIYDDIEPKLLKIVEDAVLNRNDGATEALLDAAEVGFYLPGVYYCTSLVTWCHFIFDCFVLLSVVGFVRRSTARRFLFLFSFIVTNTSRLDKCVIGTRTFILLSVRG